MTIWAEHASELCENRSQLGDMSERKGTDDDVHAAVRQGQVVQVGLVELTGRDLRSGPGEHVRRDIDADDMVAPGGEMLGMPPRAAGGIEGDALWQTVENVPNDGLLRVEEAIAGLVVELRPGAIGVDHCEQ